MTGTCDGDVLWRGGRGHQCSRHVQVHGVGSQIQLDVAWQHGGCLGLLPHPFQGWKGSDGQERAGQKRGGWR